MTVLRRVTHCLVPGHGTWCGPSQEKDGRYPRCTEERIALAHELSADGVPQSDNPKEGDAL